MANEKTIISVKEPTPKWATWVFRTVFLIGTTLNTSIIQAPRIPQPVKLDIVYWSGIVVMLVWGLSRIVGVKIDESKWQPK